VSGQGHSFPVDYWALGVFIYEMITEKTPWATGNAANDTEEAFYSKIASHYTGALQYPDAFSLELVAILDKLLEPTVAQRITAPQEFRSNGWLEVVNWEMLENGAVPAPHGPECLKQLGEHTKSGTKKCMPQSSYTGGTTWFEGFAPKSNASGSTPLMSRPPSTEPQRGPPNGEPVRDESPPEPGGNDTDGGGKGGKGFFGKKDKKKFKEATI